MRKKETLNQNSEFYRRLLAEVRQEFAEHMVERHGGKTTPTCHSCMSFRDSIKMYQKELEEPSV